MTTALLLLGLALFLVLLNGFFVAAEFALVRLRRHRIDQLADEGDKRAKRVQTQLDRLDETLSTAQLGITMASLGIGWVGEPAFATLLEPVFEAVNLVNETAQHTVSFVVGFSVIAGLHIVVGEQVPKMMAIAHAEKTAMQTSAPMRFFRLILFVPMWVLKVATDVLLNMMGLSSNGEHEAPDEDEIRHMVASSHAHGEITDDERELVDKAFEFADRTVHEVSVPRGDVAFVDVNKSFEDGMKVITTNPYTRYPVGEEGLDKVLGFLHTKDLFLADRRGQEITDFRQILRKAVFMPESNTLQEALREFQHNRQSLAVVFDEFGTVSGIVTLEDLIEEIVGEIADEFDPNEQAIIDRGDGSFLIEGDVPLHDVDEVLGTDLEEQSDGGYVSIGGLILDILGRAAEASDEVDIGGHKAKVVAVEGLRIQKVLVTPDPESVEFPPPGKDEE